MSSQPIPSSSQLWIISKAGGLIYQSAPPSGSTPPAFNAVSSNEALILAGTLHGIHAITGRLDPTNDGRSNGAMESLEAEDFGMAVKATVTGEFRGDQDANKRHGLLTLHASPLAAPQESSSFFFTHRHIHPHKRRFSDATKSMPIRS